MTLATINHKVRGKYEERRGSVMWLVYSMLLFSSLTPTAIDYNPNSSATMQQPSSVEHANYKTSIVDIQ